MKSLPSGCWTCKLRHRKCDLNTPACRECQDRCITCHGYGSKPVWMDGSAAERQELNRIKKAVKANLQNLRRGLKSRGDATNTGVRESRSPPRQAETQTHAQPAREAAVHPYLSPLGHVADDACTVSGGPNTPADARHTRHSLQEEEPAQSPIPSCVLQPKSAALIMYYLDRVFHWQFPYFRLGSRMGNRGWLLLFLANGGSLTYAALALSTLHQNALQPQRQRDCYNQDALRFHSKALRELCEVSQHTETRMLLSDKLKLAEFVAASLTLISFEVITRLMGRAGFVKCILIFFGNYDRSSMELNTTGFPTSMRSLLFSACMSQNLSFSLYHLQQQLALIVATDNHNRTLTSL